MNRTSTERVANEIDLQLFNLMNRASKMADDSRLMGERDNWTNLAQRISSARTFSRVLMNEADKREG
ncbi:MAG: hypothetical protein E6Q97_13125 [Desulfurellales bacterium]|nr:MAG: hypothetical protein E6Q97_13125 [Desulfurellales bacterium]